MSTGILPVVVMLTSLTWCLGFAIWSSLRAWKKEVAREKAEAEELTNFFIEFWSRR